jgi:hypothetical protein
MGLDFDHTRTTSFKDMEWHKLRTEIKPEFEQTYRDKLKAYVKSNKYSHAEHTIC